MDFSLQLSQICIRWISFSRSLYVSLLPENLSLRFIFHIIRCPRHFILLYVWPPVNLSAFLSVLFLFHGVFQCTSLCLYNVHFFGCLFLFISHCFCFIFLFPPSPSFCLLPFLPCSHCLRYRATFSCYFFFAFSVFRSLFLSICHCLPVCLSLSLSMFLLFYLPVACSILHHFLVCLSNSFFYFFLHIFSFLIFH